MDNLEVITAPYKKQFIDDIVNGHKFLDGVKALTQPIYKPPNGRIDYGMI